MYVDNIHCVTQLQLTHPPSLKTFYEPNTSNFEPNNHELKTKT